MMEAVELFSWRKKSVYHHYDLATSVARASAIMVRTLLSRNIPG